MAEVRKAVIAAAGFGTRFLPQTKAMPKEMLPLVDKPVIQYVVEELVAAGIEDIIIVTNSSKRSIEDHFDRAPADLLQNLREGGPSKAHLIEQVKAVGNMANFIYVRQKGPYGNGTPLINVAHLIGDEPFIYTWSDDFILATPSRFRQMIDYYHEFDASIMSAIVAKSDEDYTRYGFAAGEEIRAGVIDVQNLIEKPGKEKAPSDLATVSGVLLKPEVFGYLEAARAALEPGKELYYNDALALMQRAGHRIIAAEIQNGKYYDAGNKLEYMKTVIDFALKHEDIKDDFRKYLSEVVATSY